MPCQTELQKQLLAHLKRRHIGQENAIPSRALEARFYVHGATLRRAVLRLRLDGAPICSDRNGYYYTADPAELWGTIRRMEDRLSASVRVTQGLRKTGRTMVRAGQTNLGGAKGGERNQ